MGMLKIILFFFYLFLCITQSIMFRCLFLVLRQLSRRCLNISNVRHSSGAAVPRLRAEIQNQLDDIRAAGTYKEERVITSKQANFISVEGSERPVLNFCANNYLGLSVCYIV